MTSEILHEGKKETIFMIHGMMGGGWYWQNYKGFFEERGYCCITPTLRFHEVKPDEQPHPYLGTTSIMDYVNDLTEEIQKLDAPPILMGHSMGGLLAQILAGRGLAKGLVLLAPAPPAGIFSLKLSVIRSFQEVLTWGFWKKPFRLSFEKAVYATMHLIPEPEQRKAYERLVYESGYAAFQIGFWLLDRTRATRVDEKKVKCPVLVLVGQEDRITPAPVVKRVAEKYKGVSAYREFTGHAHWLIGEPGWQQIAATIDLWLGEQKISKGNDA